MNRVAYSGFMFLALAVFLAVRALLRTIRQVPPRRLTGPRSVERRSRLSVSVKEWLREVRSTSPQARAGPLAAISNAAMKPVMMMGMWVPLEAARRRQGCCSVTSIRQVS